MTKSTAKGAKIDKALNNIDGKATETAVVVTRPEAVHPDVTPTQEIVKPGVIPAPEDLKLAAAPVIHIVPAEDVVVRETQTIRPEDVGTLEMGEPSIQPDPAAAAEQKVDSGSSEAPPVTPVQSTSP